MDLYLYVPNVNRSRPGVKRAMSWVAKMPEVRTHRAKYADFIVPVGGDGTMLSAIHEHWKLGKPFMGIHAGTRGFLLNHINSFSEFKSMLKKLRLVEATLLVASFYDDKGCKYDRMAFNDVFFNASPGSVMEGSLRGSHYLKKNFRGDGIIVATAQGSTAYNANAGGPVLPLGHDIMAITTIASETDPIRDTLTCQPLHLKFKEKVTAHADSQRINNIVRAHIKPSSINVTLAFAQAYDFEIQRYKQQHS